MAPPQAISILCQVSWQVPYLGCRSDFNNGLRGDSNIGPILASFCLFESNNGPSLGHLNLVSDGATSVHVSYLWFPGRGHIWWRAAGLTSIMVSEVTRIVVPCPPRLWESDSNNGPPRPSQSWATSVHVSYLWFPGRCHIWPRAAGLTSIMAWKVTRIMTPFWPPAFIRVWLK